MTDPVPATLVIGLGNLLMGDDGIGLAALGRLRDEWELSPEVELVDGGTWGMNLLPMIEAADRVILLDAIRAGRKPGSVIELAGDAVPRGFEQKFSPHQIDLREVLALAMLRETLPRELVAIGIEPVEVSMMIGLSPLAEAAMPEMVARVVARLRAMGHRCDAMSSAVCTS